MQENSTASAKSQTGWLDRPLFQSLKPNTEILIFALLLVAAVFTRFYLLEPRVMSHDETSHVYFSWLFFRGQGYAHDPITHGPFQFHAIALSYFLFGASDLTARIPVALFSIATIAFAWFFRRYLGRYGALAAGLMLLISPFILYYGRYVRNESYVGLYGLVTIWAILRYFETGRDRFLYFLTTAMIMHFATKETSFIYMAQALLFVGLVFVYKVTSRPWKTPEARLRFIVLLILAIVLVAGALGVSKLAPAAASTAATPSSLNAAANPAEGSVPPWVTKTLFVLGALALLGCVYFVITGYGLEMLKQERSWDLMILLGTLVLPQLSPFLINFLHWKIPLNATEVNALQIADMLRIAAVLVPMALISVFVGLWWDRRRWLINAGIWYSIFTVLFTTLFTNGAGFFTGMIGSLGYWLAQQIVNRGSQPWYYYAAIQIPIYEYLPAIASLLAMGLFLFRPKVDLERQQAYQKVFSPGEEGLETPPVFLLLAFWSLTSLVAYSIAGEKMPWLTYHITLPMILLAGWFVGHLIESIDWQNFQKQRGWIALLLLPVFFIGFSVALGKLFGTEPPFQGQSLEQLSATSTFITALLAVLISGYGLFVLLKNYPFSQTSSLVGLVFLALLAVLTARTAFTASYINYDNATEYLVYAHSSSGPKIALQQIEDISRRTLGNLDIAVAYDNDTTYPFWWYLRNYPKAKYYAASPTRDLRESPVILVGENNFAKIEPVVGQAYYKFEYNRIWWPNQDYYNLTWTRIWNAISTPAWRNAIFRIWFYRDYTPYGELTGEDVSLTNWQPSNKMRLYVRKDVAASLWNYGTVPSQQEIQADPYEGKGIKLPADKQFGGSEGNLPGQFKKPRNLAVAPDGTFYVADTENHRIQHLDAAGKALQTWGSFADISKGQAPGGTFYEPWSVAIGKDGSVFVADTWNHRIQKFTPEGEFLTMWGYFGQAEAPEAFWGPRSVVIDEAGRVIVSDTGNKRIVIFDDQGKYISQFGTTGMQPGEFNEPTGLAIGPDGTLYVADAWNQRIQAFTPTADGSYAPRNSWDVVGWYGQSLDNKPYLAVAADGHVFASDPEGARILEFTADGKFVRYWGDFGSDTVGLNLPVGLAADAQGSLWVADSGNQRLLHFTLPPIP